VGELRFTLHAERVTDGVRARAIDELIAKHVGKRPRRRAR
jgi:hypothetical protein